MNSTEVQHSYEKVCHEKFARKVRHIRYEDTAYGSFLPLMGFYKLELLAYLCEDTGHGGLVSKP